MALKYDRVGGIRLANISLYKHIMTALIKHTQPTGVGWAMWDSV